MGVITISLDNNSECVLRESAKQKFGEKKDALSKMICFSLSKTNNLRESALNNLETYKKKPLVLSKKVKINKRGDYYAE